MTNDTPQPRILQDDPQRLSTPPRPVSRTRVAALAVFVLLWCYPYLYPSITSDLLGLREDLVLQAIDLK